MIISHKDKYIFLSNRKCASTTLRTLLSEYTKECLVVSGNSPFNVFKYDDGLDVDKENIDLHLEAKRLKKIFDIKGWDWNSYYKFTTIRNPWDRVVSTYFFVKQFTKSFRDTIVEDINTFFHKIENFVLDSNGKLLVDDIFKVENLNDDINIIFEKIGISVEIDSVPIINTINHKPYREYYNKETKNIITEYYKTEIEEFNYDF